jgi:chromosome condensin MukBEF ATPase and DNA-binding subunit MukB
MSQDLIVVKQLPVIEERLQSISEAIQAQTKEVLSLAVTEDTVKEIKKRRTELNKSFKMLEDQRKEVKSAIMAPYEAFEEVYKRYVTDIFKPADAKLKARIDEVENALLDNKKADVAAYFKEKAAAHNIDFVSFDQLGIKVTFSDSMKKLKEQVDDALNKISGDLAVIATLEFPEEILVEYKENLNLTNSVLTVKTRRAKLAAELQRKAETRAPAPIAESSPIAEPVTPVVKEPEPEIIPEPAAMEAPAAPAQSAITITIRVHSCDELMAITEICKARRLEYTIS